MENMDKKLIDNLMAERILADIARGMSYTTIADKYGVTRTDICAVKKYYRAWTFPRWAALQAIGDAWAEIE